MIMYRSPGWMASRRIAIEHDSSLIVHLLPGWMARAGITLAYCSPGEMFRGIALKCA